MVVKKKSGTKTGKRRAATKPKKTVASAKRATAAGTKRPGSRPAPAASAKAAAKPAQRNDYLRRILLTKRAEVVREIENQLGRKLSSPPGQAIDSAMDSADLSSQDMDQGVDYSLLEMRYEQYKDIADAFRKLENGTYGLCEECGQEIALKRLEVNPLARYCVACKTQIEEMQKIEREEARFKE